MPFKAIVIGATGAVGRYVVAELLKAPEFSQVTILVRREYQLPPGNESVDTSKLVQKIVDMEKLDEYKTDFEGHDKAFCCLGTTRKDAGSPEAFRKIDLDLVKQFAEICKGVGTEHFSLVSSVGANANSFFLYPKTKGEAENAVKEIGFRRTSIYRPGMIKRGDKTRFGESVIFYLTFGLLGLDDSYIARAIVRHSLVEKTGNELLSEGEIREAGK